MKCHFMAVGRSTNTGFFRLKRISVLNGHLTPISQEVFCETVLGKEGPRIWYSKKTEEPIVPK